MDLIKSIKLCIAVIATFITNYLGGFDKTIEILCLMIVLDFITGLLKAIVNKNVSSRRCFEGVIKKTCYFILIAIAYSISGFNPQYSDMVRDLVCYYLIATDALSVLENIGDCGVPYPKFLRDILEQLKDNSDKGELNN